VPPLWKFSGFVTGWWSHFFVCIARSSAGKPDLFLGQSQPTIVFHQLYLLVRWRSTFFSTFWDLPLYLVGLIFIFLYFCCFFFYFDGLRFLKYFKKMYLANILFVSISLITTVLNITFLKKSKKYQLKII
jgi:hypothetical protein